MDNLKILDCTLRDGGYINDWKFKKNNIKSIVSRLTKANIDIIECGFLEDGKYDEDISLFTDVDQIKRFLPENKGQTSYVAMTRYGFLDINRLKPYDRQSIDGIRITFHEDEVKEAIQFCKLVQQKGYKVYVQPVGTTSYSDRYLLELIEMVNDLKPYAFYIVDTLGLMRKNDLLRMFYLVDNNLNKDISIGYHSHNNLQLAFSNAQELVELHTKRHIIIDSSVYGMGRGAGNLNTELITQHLNFIKEQDRYITDYLLEVIDEIINPLFKEYTWGYSVPYYLAAINNCHPNYASYLMNRKTLPVKSIGNILRNITHDKRELFDSDYILQMYTEYQKHQVDDQKDLYEFSKSISGKRILILAPGSSVKKQSEAIRSHIERHNSVVISVNYDGDAIASHYCYFSNDKRFQEFKGKKNTDEYGILLTSNIHADESEYCFRFNYSDFLNAQPLVNDNAVLMLLSLLIKLQVQEVDLAGFDGFQADDKVNYSENTLENSFEHDFVIEMNRQISEVVNEYESKIRLNFITESLYRRSSISSLA